MTGGIPLGRAGTPLSVEAFPLPGSAHSPAERYVPVQSPQPEKGSQADTWRVPPQWASDGALG